MERKAFIPFARPVATDPPGSPIEHMANPFQFLQDVRTEAGKVTWPTRRETVITTILVVVMCVFASLFLFTVDQAIHLGINLILGFGR